MNKTDQTKIMIKNKVLVFAFALLSITEALAQLKSGNNVIISDEIDQDLYVAGRTVTVNAPVHGDLIAAGGTVTVTDTITQDYWWPEVT